jgi:hypothetical protein
MAPGALEEVVTIRASSLAERAVAGDNQRGLLKALN